MNQEFKVGIFRVAVAVLIERGSKILITKRSANRDHAPNTWEAGITGRIDQGETAEMAAVREAKEETGLEVNLIAPVGTFHFYRGIERIEHVGISFWARSDSGEVELDHNEQSEYRWVTPEEALSFIVDLSIRKEVEQYLDFKSRYRLV